MRVDAASLTPFPAGRPAHDGARAILFGLEADVTHSTTLYVTSVIFNDLTFIWEISNKVLNLV